MALFFNLFNTPKPKQFNYRPVFYDERKERLEKMKAEAEAAGKRPYTGLNKGFLSAQRKRKPSLEKSSALRFFIILIVLLIILYFIMPEMFQAFWKAKN